MHVKRALRTKNQVDGPLRRFVPFEEHYALYKTHIQVVRVSVSVPVVEGFQCPSWEQDAEQNALLKHILFTPRKCDGAMDCGSHRFRLPPIVATMSLRRLKSPAFAGGAHGTRWHGAGANAKLEYSSKPRERRPSSKPLTSI